VDSKPVDIDPSNFSSVKEVLDFIDCDGCNAITELKTAVYQRNGVVGWIGLSKQVAKELLPHYKEDKPKPKKYLDVTSMSNMPVKYERLLASSLYMMKDKRDEFCFETLGKENWGEICKVSTLSKCKYSRKIHFTYDSIHYVTILSFLKESGFSILIGSFKEDCKLMKAERNL
jgi:hypothetical protein